MAGSDVDPIEALFARGVTDGLPVVPPTAGRVMAAIAAVGRSPDEVIAEEHSGAIHVVLTDVMMPGINGKQLGDRLLALRPDIKTIFMSGRAAEVISDAGVLIPVDAFVAKPFTVATAFSSVCSASGFAAPL